MNAPNSHGHYSEGRARVPGSEPELAVSSAVVVTIAGFDRMAFWRIIQA
jgi:hypothetical protein